MSQVQNNKEFIINYYNEFASGVAKNREAAQKYIADEALLSHMEFFEKAFPCYKLSIDELTAEGNRVIVRARTIGTHLGYLGDIPPTGKEVDIPFVICYEIENNMIVNHWMISDQLILMQQLGLAPASDLNH